MTFLTIKGTCELSDCYLLQFDGGAVPNPGTCGSGAVIFDLGGACLWELGEYFAHGTNNEAEYRGLELGLTVALREGIKNIKIEGDSKLVISQISGLWKVKAPGLLGIFKRVSLLINKFDSVACRHVYRELNTHADKITNELQLTRASFERQVSKKKLT